MGQQVRGLHVVHTDVHVGEGLGVEVVDLPRHVQDVAHAAATEGLAAGHADKQSAITHARTRTHHRNQRHSLVLLQLLKVSRVPFGALKAERALRQDSEGGGAICQ